MAAVLNITLRGNDDEITFRGDGQGSYHLMPDIRGLGLPAQRVSAFKFQGRDGDFVSQQFFSSRTIVFLGRVKGATQAELDTNVTQVYRKCLIRDGKTIKTTAIIQMRNGNVYQLDCNVRDVDPIITRRKNKRLMPFLLQATDPNLYQSVTDSIAQVHKQSGTPGYVMPYTLPTTWGASASTIETINLIGQAVIHPVIEIVGTGSNPVITNKRTGQSLGFNVVLADQTLVIDMSRHTALIDDVSQINNLDFDNNNQWWVLLPGDNQIELASSEATDNLVARIKFRPAEIGIA